MFLQQLCMPVVATAISSPKKFDELGPELQQLVRKCITIMSKLIDEPPAVPNYNNPAMMPPPNNQKPCAGCQ